MYGTPPASWVRAMVPSARGRWLYRLGQRVEGGDPSALADLHGLEASSRRRDVASAAVVLSELVDPPIDLLPTLVAVATSKEPEVRYWGLDAASRLGPEVIGPHLEELLDSAWAAEEWMTSERGLNHLHVWRQHFQRLLLERDSGAAARHPAPAWLAAWAAAQSGPQDVPELPSYSRIRRSRRGAATSDAFLAGRASFSWRTGWRYWGNQAIVRSFNRAGSLWPLRALAWALAPRVARFAHDRGLWVELDSTPESERLVELPSRLVEAMARQNLSLDISLWSPELGAELERAVRAARRGPGVCGPGIWATRGCEVIGSTPHLSWQVVSHVHEFPALSRGVPLLPVGADGLLLVMRRTGYSSSYGVSRKVVAAMAETGAHLFFEVLPPTMVVALGCGYSETPVDPAEEWRLPQPTPWLDGI